jgi:Zn-dependent protease
MLTEPTPFDLRMHVFRIPVRVHPSFWLLGLILGWDPDMPQMTLICTVCVFFSILIHELGHALTAEAFGWRSEIVLYLFGGLAFSERWHNRTPTKDIFVSVAGPAAQFCLLPLLFATELGLAQTEFGDQIYVRAAMHYLWFINIVWPILNLMPVLPLDGGHILQGLFELFGLRDPLAAALIVSIIVGGLLSYASYTLTGGGFGMWFIVLTIMNIQAYQQHRAQRW